MKTFSVVAILFCGPGSVLAQIIKVPQDYSTIQTAIDSAQTGDTVLVAEGTYVENLKIAKKITVASLYVLDNDTSHISKTIIDGGSPSHPDSASVILILPGTDSTTVIKGFTIQNGKGTLAQFPLPEFGNPSYRSGGGILIIANGGATISSNIIKNNSCQASGEIHTFAAGIAIIPDSKFTIAPNSWIIENNSILNNNTDADSWAVGGGLFLIGPGRCMNNIIMNNSSSGPKGEAAGVLLTDVPGLANQHIELSNNLITHNVTSWWAGGIGLGADGGGHVTMTLKNNIITNNSAGSFGGALGVNGGNYSLINNTIAGNSGPEALFVESSAGPLTFRLMNNIIWNPDAGSEFNEVTDDVTSAYNCVRRGLEGISNIDTDPLFVVNDSLYRLSSSSPCISAGVMMASVGDTILTAPVWDYLGMTRPRPSNTQPDMGAIEYDMETSVKEKGEGIPKEFVLEQNYPNPLNPTTTISYQLTKNSYVTLKIYDLVGREVETLVIGEKPAGKYEVSWYAGGFSSGLYFYRLKSENFVQTKKLILLR